jgi:raffinose/stachyose/melibiose transport system permease protein
MRFPGRSAVFIFFLVGLAVPVQVTLQPLLVMMKNLGIANSIAALIPPYLAFGMPFQIFVMRGFFRLLPTELIEAARVDGASNAVIFFRIMLPLSLPPLATLAIIDTLATWNEFLIALVLISGQTSRTVPVGLLQFQGEFNSQYTLLMAGVLISILPVLAVFIFLQRYFVAGLAGGVKG